METQEHAIKFSKKWYNIKVRYIILYFIGLFVIPMLSGLHPFAIFGIWIVGVGSPILFSMYLDSSSQSWVNSLKNQQFPENLDVRNRDHDAFVIIHSMGSFSIYTYVGLDILIQYFIRKKFPFKIYHCYNPQEFQEILKNDRAKYLWIIGHGWRGGITFKWMKTSSERFSRKKKRTLFPYAKIRDDIDQFPKKAFIAQLHCNHFDKTYAHNESLVEILLDPFEDSRYYITDSLSFVISNWFAIRDLVPKIERASVEASEIQKGIEPDSGGCSWLDII